MSEKNDKNYDHNNKKEISESGNRKYHNLRDYYRSGLLTTLPSSLCHITSNAKIFKFN